MITRTTSLAMLIVVGLAGCEKSASKGSGALAGADAELFKSLPSGATIVFGGNFMKLQKLMADSVLSKLTQQVTSALGKGMKEWTDCFGALKGVQIAGTASLGGGGGDLRIAMTGVGLPDVTACAGKAGFKAAPDPDGKFVAIDVPSPTGTVTQGYLKLASGALYTRQHIGMGGGARAVVTPGTRAELEADLAGLASGTAATDARLQAVVAKADRSKPMWFAGTAAGTPIADKLGEVYGTMDFDAGIALDVTAQVTDQAIATKVEDGLRQAKQSVDRLPAEAKDVVKAIELSRDGDRLRLAIKLSDAQLSNLVNMAGALGGRR